MPRCQEEMFPIIVLNNNSILRSLFSSISVNNVWTPL